MISIKKTLLRILCATTFFTSQFVLADDAMYYQMIQDLQFLTLTQETAVEIGLPPTLAGISMLEAKAIAPLECAPSVHGPFCFSKTSDPAKTAKENCEEDRDKKVKENENKATTVLPCVKSGKKYCYSIVVPNGSCSAM